MDDVFPAISDPTRRAILRLLSGKQMPAGAIAAHFDQQRPAISKHLAILRQAGLLTETRRRQERPYAIRPGSLDPLRVFLAEIRPPDDGVIQTATARILARGPSAFVPAPPRPTNLSDTVTKRESQSLTPAPTNEPAHSDAPEEPATTATRGFNLEFD